MRAAEDADEVLQDDLRAFAAEVETASWKSAKGLERAFAEARIEGRRAIIDLDERNCVAIIVDYERSVTVVEYAGPSAKYDTISATGGKSGPSK